MREDSLQKKKGVGWQKAKQTEKNITFETASTSTLGEASGIA